MDIISGFMEIQYSPFFDPQGSRSNDHYKSLVYEEVVIHSLDERSYIH